MISASGVRGQCVQAVASGVIHSVPAKTKEQRINKETRPPRGAGPYGYSVKMPTRGFGGKFGCVWFTAVLEGVMSRPIRVGRFRKVPWPSSDSALQRG